ncbi:MAG: DUF4286 family protein [Bdellovibrionales bacterium]|nr:DUF4286 family protein [Bdellovibrionales bacterium]
MLIYEVNIKISNSIYDRYIEWLEEHVKEMLTLDHFKEAKIFKTENQNNETEEICVHYVCKSRQNLQTYFDTQAQSMRAEGTDAFQNQYEIHRRILIET